MSVDLSSDAFVFHPNLGLSASELKPETVPNHNEHTEFAATHSTMHHAHENIIADFAHVRSLRTTPRSHNFTKVICLFNPLRCSVRINWTDEVRRLIIQQARQ